LPLAPSTLLTLLQAAFEQAFSAIIITTAGKHPEGLKIIYCNPAFCKMTGFSQKELLGKSPKLLQGPLTSPKVIQHLHDTLAKGTVFHGSTFNYRKDRSPYLVEWNVSPVRNDAGEVEAYLSIQQDITERTKGERLKNLLASALHATEDAVMIANLNAEIVFVNQAFERQTGYQFEEISGRTPQFLQAGNNRIMVQKKILSRLARGEHCQITLTSRHKDGHLYYSAQTITPLKDDSGNTHHYVSISKDVTTEVEKVQALRKQAHHDALTGLLNRHAGERRLKECVSAATTTNMTYGLILADIDTFKKINDTYGHQAGDDVLRTCATLLRQSVRATDHIVRWGGEEFLIILPHCEPEQAQEIAQRICTMVASTPIPSVQSMTLSIGVAMGDAAQPQARVLRRADRALYLAKQKGRNQVVVAE